METVNVHEAKTQLSRLLERAHQGEEIIIAKNGQPYARLVPLEEPKKRQLGFLQGTFQVGDEFFEPLSDEELDRLSGYYLAAELAQNQHAVEVLVDAAEWCRLQRLPAPTFWQWARQVAQHIRTRAFHKHPRGPKRPRVQRATGKQRHHYSTYRLLHPD